LQEKLPSLLHVLLDFQFLHLALYDTRSSQLHSWLTEPATEEFYPAGVNLMADLPYGMVWRSREPWLGSDPYRSSFPRLAAHLAQRGLQSFFAMPLLTATDCLGVLACGSTRRDAYTADDIALARHAARCVAFAIERAQNADVVHRSRIVQDELERVTAIREVARAVTCELDLSQLVKAVSCALRRVLGVEYTDLLLRNPTGTGLRRLAVSFDGGSGRLREGVVPELTDAPAQIALRTGKVYVATQAIMANGALKFEPVRLFVQEGLLEACCVPLISRGTVLGTLNIGSTQPGRYTPEAVDLLEAIGKSVAVAVANALAFEEISHLKEKLAREKFYLQDQIKATCNFGDIIGSSPTLREVFRQVESVADTDATVLILGETGTGKELVAHAIHQLSPRHERTFVKLNCASIPATLMESELFGHERGAYTGAISTQMGLMELAHKGTLFLDEVGDLPVELQPKLLRAMQQREVRRLGSLRTIQVDVRVIAATNCDLAQLVADRQFRCDLYYRLNVFPITVPPLRERREDIPLLVRHFALKFAARARREIEAIPNDTMDALMRWNWPGNVRELENLIERAVILSRGPVLNVPLADFHLTPARLRGAPSLQALNRPVATTALRDRQREEILTALRASNFVVGGPRGAAARLGLKRTTLLWRMQRLGISPNRQGLLLRPLQKL
jgi:formate hydrogenlyase transcriptional activator